MTLQREVQMDCILNLHKRLHGVKFKNRAAIILCKIRDFSKKTMNCKDVRIDTKINKHIWKTGSRHAPFRIGLKLTRKQCISKNGKDNNIVFVSIGKQSNF